MAKVLLISPFPYTKSNRGMDIFTEAFEASGWETHHLIFPKVFYTIKKKATFQTNVKESSARKTLLPYIDLLMNCLPTFFFRWIKRNHQRKAKHINGNNYDVIVLESGKPLFLQDLIPDTARVIYRQSDPVRLFLGKNPDYIALEDKVYQRADHILLVKDRYRDEIPTEIRSKTRVIRNGYTQSIANDTTNPFHKGSRNAVYMGLAPIETIALRIIALENPNVDFHLFGTALRGIVDKRVAKLSNIINHGFADSSEFMPYLQHADMFILPFIKDSKIAKVGITSKLYMAMNLGLPIVSFPMDAGDEFDGLPVDFCETSKEFAKTVGLIAKTRPRRKYDLPWDELNHAARLAEFKDFIETLN